MRRERGEFAIECIQNIQHAAHHADRVATFRRQAPVRRASLRHNFKPGITLVRDREAQIGRLDHDRRVRGVALEQSFGADAVALFIYDGCDQQRLLNRPRCREPQSRQRTSRRRHF